ncbi:serine/threonine-protein kinase [Pseudomonas saudimassiliensis]|uniref:Serine/threonine-protein kinase n=1 Tax=Pseudomonas saudimassiliensis TaxID=1461581 RepID=A0A078M9Y1_9PSED|nr:bifunctional protein-serine/threonine kinase/phosphatase [Pseudomonas saudimassiliensis]CEA02172.1 serine/threonine-protein kinase [Pseudomonas saudimassiliensis]CEF25754.1 serine/threonine-protein kinase [Pseudomonas saudimassiliensis]
MTSAAQARPVSGRVAPGARLDIALGQASDRGRKAVNQDCHGGCVPAEPQLSAKGAVAVLADGISSSAVSHIASQTAVAGFLADYYCTPDAWSVRKSAQRVLAATNAWLHGQTRRGAPGQDADRGYVCTFSALIIKSATAYLFHVGDARIYRLRGSDLEQLTRDHRLQVSAEHSYLARALGIGPHLEIDHLTLGIERGDLFLLATDGVHEYLDPQWLYPLLAEHHSDLDAAAQRIIEQALALGSADNLTVQLVRIDNLPPLAMAEHSGKLADLPPAPLLESRAEFDGFTVERELHASSRSHVYLVTDRESGKRLVLKVPSTDQRQDSQYLERLMLEEWVARRIDSPHVAKAEPLPRQRRYLYSVSELIEGQTLHQWMLDHPQPDLQQVRDIVEQIAKGLRAFQRLDMLHQDLRPQNIMIDRAGTVKIIDFGSVQVAGLEELDASASPPPMLGTLQYSAPEYFLGLGGSPRSDLFSLGVITYHMLTGNLPYGTELAKATTRAAQLRLGYRSVQDYRPDLPVWLDEVLKRAVHPDPHKRYAALSEFTFDLRQPGGARLAGPRPSLLERNPVAVWQGIALGLAVALVLALSRLASG